MLRHAGKQDSANASPGSSVKLLTGPNRVESPMARGLTITAINLRVQTACSPVGYKGSGLRTVTWCVTVYPQGSK